MLSVNEKNIVLEFNIFVMNFELIHTKTLKSHT